MNTPTRVLFASSLILLLSGTGSAAETAAPAETAPPAADTTPAETEKAPAASSAQEAKATTAETPARTHTEDTVKGAFGIPLGEKFEPSMVAKILDKKEETYNAYKGAMATGTRFDVEPKAPSEDFQKYAVVTTPDGIVFEIRANYAHEEKQNQCERTKAMAADFETKYGKARGKDIHGAWYSFRPPTDLTRSASIYAHRCGSGIYLVVYRDHAARKASAPEPAETDGSAGVPEATEPGESAEKEVAGEAGKTSGSPEATQTTEATESGKPDKAAEAAATGGAKASTGQ